MKALTYLQTAQLANNNEQEYMERLRQYDRLNFFGNYRNRGISIETALIEFHSQPFKPELITEIYVGFTVNKTTNLYVYNSKSELAMIVYDLVKEIHFYYKNSVKVIIPITKTLDKFIGYCEDAGIELEIKERI